MLNILACLSFQNIFGVLMCIHKHFENQQTYCTLFCNHKMLLKTFLLSVCTSPSSLLASCVVLSCGLQSMCCILCVLRCSLISRLQFQTVRLSPFLAIINKAALKILRHVFKTLSYRILRTDQKLKVFVPSFPFLTAFVQPSFLFI